MLTLPIKRKWFDMICRGEKREEYREPTDYWKERLFRARGRAPENEIPDPFHLKIFPDQIQDILNDPGNINRIPHLRVVLCVHNMKRD